MQRKSVITACIDRLTSSGLECAIEYDTVTDATCKGFESSHQSPAKMAATCNVSRQEFSPRGILGVESTSLPPNHLLFNTATMTMTMTMAAYSTSNSNTTTNYSPPMKTVDVGGGRRR